MKITKRQLRRIIREAIGTGIGGQGNDSLGSEMKHPDQVPIGQRGIGWADFQGMAQSGDYEGAGDWLQDIAKDRGLTINRDIEDGMIDFAQREEITVQELENELKSWIDPLSKG